MNTDQSDDVEFNLSHFRIEKEENGVVSVVEEFITEAYVTKNSYELVKCELSESLSSDMITEEEVEEKVFDQSQIIHLDSDEDKVDIENILLIDDYRCALCLQSFTSQADLNLHTSLYNPNEVHHCNYCAQSFHTKRVWSAHVETHLQSKEFICMVCLHCCSSTGELQTHLASLHPHVQRSSAKSKMAVDKKKSSAEPEGVDERYRRKTYTCAICNATYRLRQTLIRHLQNHNHLCATCGEGFVTKERLKYHIRAKHDPQPRNMCEPCNRGFCSKSALKRHQQLIHDTSTPYLCQICNKYYASKSSLVTHSRIHLGQKQFVCPKCGKGFMRKDRLDSHLSQFHGAEGGHLCVFCGKCISRRENLKYHLRLHTGEKPFQCSVCSKSFPSQTALKKHMVIHTTSILFTCHICERTIARKDNFLAHLRIHGGKEKVVCQSEPPLMCR